MAPAEDRGQHHRQGDAERGAQRAGAEDVGGVLHFGRHHVQRRGGEDEDVGEGIDRDVEDQSGEGIDVEQALIARRSAPSTLG